MQSLIAVLSFNQNTANECHELQKQLQDGLITETEFRKKLIDLATRNNALSVEVLGQLTDGAFPYSVATGKYESDGSENCKYCDDFATLRDAIIAWEEYSPGCAWSRIEHRVDNYIYGLDPYKVSRAKKIVDDKGEKRTIYMKCDANGDFITPTESPMMAIINRFNSHFGHVTEAGKYMMLVDTVPGELILRTISDQGRKDLTFDDAARYLAKMDIDELRSALLKAAEAIYVNP